MLYRVYGEFDGVMSRVGHATENLRRASERATALFHGEVREFGTDIPVYIAGVYVSRAPVLQAKPAAYRGAIKVSQ